MKLSLEQLPAALAKSLQPVYLLSGDEPLQLNEAADAIRKAAYQRGYVNRELFFVDSGFDWLRLAEARGTASLFGEMRILDLRLPAKPDKDGAAALEAYVRHIPDDAILMVSLPKLTAKEQNAAWFQALERAGGFVPVQPLTGQALIQWLKKRMSAKGMMADTSGLTLLANRVEGNLLAAAQEIEKLHILYGPTQIGDDKIRKAVADSSRHDVFELAGVALAGQIAHTRRVLSGLRSEGVGDLLVLWALSREIRLLCTIKHGMGQGDTIESAIAKSREKIWGERKAHLSNAAQRLTLAEARRALQLCAKADRVIKGMEKGDAWEVLMDICICLVGGPMTRIVN